MENDNTLNIILAAGRKSQVGSALNSYSSHNMVPINGKPAISRALNELIRKNILSVKIVSLEDDIIFNEFIQLTFGKKMNIELLKIKKSKSILDSLKKGLDKLDDSFSSIRIMLADTLIKDSYNFDINAVYYQNVNDSQRWCIIKINENNYIKAFHDKEKHLKDPLYALCGYYHLTNFSLVKQMVIEAHSKGGSQLSHFLKIYNDNEPIKAISCDEWLDFGNIDNFFNAKKSLLQSRYFNRLIIDPLLNTITKDSVFDQKLRHELNWYNSLPARLKILTPRIISQEEKNGRLHLVQEYYGYPTVSELFLYGNLNYDNWSTILRKLLSIHEEFTKIEGDLGETEFRAIYIDKTYERLEF